MAAACDSAADLQRVTRGRRLHCCDERKVRSCTLQIILWLTGDQLPATAGKSISVSLIRLKTLVKTDGAMRLKSALRTAGLPVMPSETHIVPVHVGDPEKCKSVSKLLLWKHGIYIQPINYPTVPRGHERLRITPSPHHSDELMDHLAVALTDVWDQLNLPRLNQGIVGSMPTP